MATEGTATAGTVTVTVRVNGAPTGLACSVPTAGGACKIIKTPVPILAEDLVAIQIVSTLDAGAWTFSYSIQFD